METDYSAFDGVFQKNYYWSCQPAFQKRKMDVDMTIDIIIMQSSAKMEADYYVDDIGGVEDNNIGRARATMVEYVGDNQYESQPSDVPGYSGTQSGSIIYKDLDNSFWNTKYGWVYTPGNYISNGILNYDGNPGNKPRISSNQDNWARVRCVYKP
jgi:hypothetical protein